MSTDWRETEALVLETLEAMLLERGAPDIEIEALWARLEGRVSREAFEDYMPDMSAAWRGLALVRGMPLPAAGPDYRARITNLDLRAVSAFVQARLLEHRAGSRCPVVPDLFWAMAAPEVVPVAHLLYAVTDLALGSPHRELMPSDLIAWVSHIKGWHIVFYTAVPEPSQWLAPPHTLMPFGGLDYMVHLERDADAPERDSIARFKGGGMGRVWGDERFGEPDVVMMAEHGAVFREHANPVWPLWEAESGLRLEDVLAAMAAGGLPAVLIRQGVVVVERPG